MEDAQTILFEMETVARTPGLSEEDRRLARNAFERRAGAANCDWFALTVAYVMRRRDADYAAGALEFLGEALSWARPGEPGHPATAAAAASDPSG